jgi:hypothetical protein
MLVVCKETARLLKVKCGHLTLPKQVQGPRPMQKVSLTWLLWENKNIRFIAVSKRTNEQHMVRTETILMISSTANRSHVQWD